MSNFIWNFTAFRSEFIQYLMVGHDGYTQRRDDKKMFVWGLVVGGWWLQAMVSHERTCKEISQTRLRGESIGVDRRVGGKIDW